MSHPWSWGSAYDWLRGLHILAVIAWMAGLLFLPRLFAYDVEQEGKPEPLRGEMQALLRGWQLRLLRIILNPAMALALVLGLALIWTRSGGLRETAWLGTPWMGVKFTGVLFLLGWHGYLAASRKRLAAGTNRRSAKFWRLVNELPFVAAIFMVLAVTTEFGRG